MHKKRIKLWLTTLLIIMNISILFGLNQTYQLDGEYFRIYQSLDPNHPVLINKIYTGIPNATYNISNNIVTISSKSESVAYNISNPFYPFWVSGAEKSPTINSGTRNLVLEDNYRIYRRYASGGNIMEYVNIEQLNDIDVQSDGSIHLALLDRAKYLDMYPSNFLGVIYQVVHCYSYDNGASWASEVVTEKVHNFDDSTTVSSLSYPSMVVDGDNNMHIVYIKKELDSYSVCYSKKDFGTLSWSTPIVIDSDVSDATKLKPRIKIDDDDNLYIIWLDMRGNDQYKTYLTYSTDSGDTWASDMLVSLPSDMSHVHDVALDKSGSLYVGYIDRNFTPYWTFKLRKTSDFGISWEDLALCDESLNFAGYFSFTFDSNDKLTLIWETYYSDWIQKIMYASSIDKGLTWNVSATPLSVSDTLNTIYGPLNLSADVNGELYATWLS